MTLLKPTVNRMWYHTWYRPNKLIHDRTLCVLHNVFHIMNVSVDCNWQITLSYTLWDLKLSYKHYRISEDVEISLEEHKNQIQELGTAEMAVILESMIRFDKDHCVLFNKKTALRLDNLRCGMYHFRKWLSLEIFATKYFWSAQLSQVQWFMCWKS